MRNAIRARQALALETLLALVQILRVSITLSLETAPAFIAPSCHRHSELAVLKSAQAKALVHFLAGHLVNQEGTKSWNPSARCEALTYLAATSLPAQV
jgi:hypothetical protein